MNKRRRYKAKHRRRWALIVRQQMDGAHATVTAENAAQIGAQILAACERAMGLPKHTMMNEIRARTPK